MQEPVPGISAVPDEQNARYFHVVVAGKFYLIIENKYKNIGQFKSDLCTPL